MSSINGKLVMAQKRCKSTSPAVNGGSGDAVKRICSQNSNTDDEREVEEAEVAVVSGANGHLQNELNEITNLIQQNGHSTSSAEVDHQNGNDSVLQNESALDDQKDENMQLENSPFSEHTKAKTESSNVAAAAAAQTQETRKDDDGTDKATKEVNEQTKGNAADVNVEEDDGGEEDKREETHENGALPPSPSSPLPVISEQMYRNLDQWMNEVEAGPPVVMLPRSFVDHIKRFAMSPYCLRPLVQLVDNLPIGQRQAAAVAKPTLSSTNGQVADSCSSSTTNSNGKASTAANADANNSTGIDNEKITNGTSASTGNNKKADGHNNKMASEQNGKSGLLKGRRLGNIEEEMANLNIDPHEATLDNAPIPLINHLYQNAYDNEGEEGKNDNNDAIGGGGDDATKEEDPALDTPVACDSVQLIQMIRAVRASLNSNRKALKPKRLGKLPPLRSSARSSTFTDEEMKHILAYMERSSDSEVSLTGDEQDESNSTESSTDAAAATNALLAPKALPFAFNESFGKSLEDSEKSTKDVDLEIQDYNGELVEVVVDSSDFPQSEQQQQLDFKNFLNKTIVESTKSLLHEFTSEDDDYADGETDDELGLRQTIDKVIHVIDPGRAPSDQLDVESEAHQDYNRETGNIIGSVAGCSSLPLNRFTRSSMMTGLLHNASPATSDHSYSVKGTATTTSTGRSNGLTRMLELPDSPQSLNDDSIPEDAFDDGYQDANIGRNTPLQDEDNSLQSTTLATLLMKCATAGRLDPNIPINEGASCSKQQPITSFAGCLKVIDDDITDLVKPNLGYFKASAFSSFNPNRPVPPPPQFTQQQIDHSKKLGELFRNATIDTEPSIIEHVICEPTTLAEPVVKLSGKAPMKKQPPLPPRPMPPSMYLDDDDETIELVLEISAKEAAYAKASYGKQPKKPTRPPPDIPINQPIINFDDDDTVDLSDMMRPSTSGISSKAGPSGLQRAPSVEEIVEMDEETWRSQPSTSGLQKCTSSSSRKNIPGYEGRKSSSVAVIGSVSATTVGQKRKRELTYEMIDSPSSMEDNTEDNKFIKPQITRPSLQRSLHPKIIGEIGSGRLRIPPANSSRTVLGNTGRSGFVTYNISQSNEWDLNVGSWEKFSVAFTDAAPINLGEALDIWKQPKAFELEVKKRYTIILKRGRDSQLGLQRLRVNISLDFKNCSPYERKHAIENWKFLEEEEQFSVNKKRRLEEPRMFDITPNAFTTNIDLFEFNPEDQAHQLLWLPNGTDQTSFDIEFNCHSDDFEKFMSMSTFPIRLVLRMEKVLPGLHKTEFSKLAKLSCGIRTLKNKEMEEEEKSQRMD